LIIIQTAFSYNFSGYRINEGQMEVQRKKPEITVWGERGKQP
jgi:hypothetical protein